MYTPNCIRFTCSMTLRGSCEHTYKDFSDLFILLGSYDIALSISIQHMPDRLPRAVRSQMTLGENTFAVFHDNLYFKNSRSQVTSDDPKLFFQMLDIYSGNIIVQGY